MRWSRFSGCQRSSIHHPRSYPGTRSGFVTVFPHTLRATDETTRMTPRDPHRQVTHINKYMPDMGTSVFPFTPNLAESRQGREEQVRPRRRELSPDEEREKGRERVATICRVRPKPDRKIGRLTARVITRQTSRRQSRLTVQTYSVWTLSERASARIDGGLVTVACTNGCLALYYSFPSDEPIFGSEGHSETEMRRTRDRPDCGGRPKVRTNGHGMGFRSPPQ
jgi:hypothetical protein